MSTLISNDAWEEELQRFIEFGVLLDRKTREYLVAYLQHKVGLASEPPSSLYDTYLDYFTRALDGIFGEQLVALLQDREVLARQVAMETLKWLRKTHRKVQSAHPYDDEKNRLEMWSITPMFRFVGRWEHMTRYLDTVYQRHELDASFYKKEFEERIQNRPLEEIPEDSVNRVDLLLTDLLSQWDALLHAKILHFQLNVLEEEQQTFQDTLEARIDEYQKFSDLLGPFAEYLGRYWDTSREPLKQTNFDVLTRYNELLENEDSIRELAEMLGRMRQAELELEEETYERVVVTQHWVEHTNAKGPFEGVHHSNDLNVMLSSEAGLLSDPDTESLFLAKYAEQQLLTLKYDDRERVTHRHQFTESYERVKQKEKGPFIICVDTSDSMHGLPEHIAKVLCFAILKMAAKDNRRAYLINFSVGVRTIDLHDIANSLDEIVAFLQMSFHGGTSITLPMYEVMKQLETENYQDADVLLISDFIMYSIEDDILRSIRFFQEHQNTQFHSLTLSEQVLEPILQVFDSSWVYDPNDKGILPALAENIKVVAGRGELRKTRELRVRIT